MNNVKFKIHKLKGLPKHFKSFTSRFDFLAYNENSTNAMNYFFPIRF